MVYGGCGRIVWTGPGMGQARQTAVHSTPKPYSMPYKYRAEIPFLGGQNTIGYSKPNSCMLYRINTNLTVGGGSRGYGLGSTPNRFSLLTGLLRARENDERPMESRWNQPAPDYASTSWRHPWDHDKFCALTSPESNHEFKSR